MRGSLSRPVARQRMNRDQPASLDGELYGSILACSRWHAGLYRWCGRIAVSAFVASLVILCTSLVRPVEEWWQHRWAGFYLYAPEITLRVVPFLGLAWLAAVVRHHVYVRYQPSSQGRL